MCISCAIVYGMTSCKTASGWWVILVKYVLIKKKTFTLAIKQGIGGRNSAERDQNLIRSRGYHNECIHQVWDHSPERFVRKTQKCDGGTDARTNGRTNRRTNEQAYSKITPTELQGQKKHFHAPINIQTSCWEGNENASNIFKWSRSSDAYMLPVNYAIIGSYNELSSVWRQTWPKQACC